MLFPQEAQVCLEVKSSLTLTRTKETVKESMDTVTNIFSHHGHFGKNNDSDFHSRFLRNNGASSAQWQLWPIATM